jgi:hypothetical protein
MKKTFPLLSGLCLLLALAAPTEAQSGPPKVVLIEREVLKPGAAPSHERESNNFARMLAHAKRVPGEKTYLRLGMTPIAGDVNEVLYLYPFASFEEVAQRDRDLERWLTRPGPMNAFFTQVSRESAPPQSGVNADHHASQRAMLAAQVEELTYNPRVNLGEARYVEMIVFRVKPGQDANLMKVGRSIVAAHREAKTDAHFVTYRVVGGSVDGTYITLMSLKDLSEMMPPPAQQAAYLKALNDKLGMSEMQKLIAETLQNSETNVYAIRPTMSHVPDEWVKADPAFWRQELPPPPPPPAAARTASMKRRPR